MTRPDKVVFQRVCSVIRQDKVHLLHILLGCPAQVCLTGGLFYMCLFLSFLLWLFSARRAELSRFFGAQKFCRIHGDFKFRGRTVALNVDWQGKKFCALPLTFIHITTLKITEKFFGLFSGWLTHKTTLLAADEDGWLIGGNTLNERTTKTEFFVWMSGCSTRGE